MKRVVVIVGSICIIVSLILFFNRNTSTTMKAKTDQVETKKSEMKEFSVTPISHATMVMSFGGQTIYTDPVGGSKPFQGQPDATIILVTDIHPDHLDGETLKSVANPESVVVVPQSLFEVLPKDLQGRVFVLHNGEKTIQKGIEIEAVPMYNTPEAEDTPHQKGRGNGYIVSDGEMRIYIAGDTDATPEMKALTHIDVAFIPMNPPYTMDVEEAADGVLAFSPKVVHPYHYRTPSGLSDIKKFKELVESQNKNIHVDLLNFYP